jgi:glycosyltransferase involved in cell wall biosynthesis
MLFDRLIGLFATHLLADSQSQAEYLSQCDVVARSRIEVLGEGSIAGVNLDCFFVDRAAGVAVRRSLGIPLDSIVWAFVGRINRDKGIIDLARAFVTYAQHSPRAHLLIVGPDEEGLIPLVMELCASKLSHVTYLGQRSDVADLLRASDVLCLPSYREGFGTVILEAAACGVPAIGSNIPGVADAIQHDLTGLLHDVRDIPSLVATMRLIGDDDGMRHRLGVHAEMRARSLFSARTSSAHLLSYYVEKVSRFQG